MLDNNDVVGWLEKRSDQSGGLWCSVSKVDTLQFSGYPYRKTLLDIEERTWLVEHVNIGLLNNGQTNGETLQFTTRQDIDITLVDLLELENVDNLIESLVADLGSLLQEGSNLALGTLDGARDLIDVLRLNDGFDVVLQDSREEVLQLATTVITQNLGPIRLLAGHQTLVFISLCGRHSHRRIFPSWASGVH